MAKTLVKITGITLRSGHGTICASRVAACGTKRSGHSARHGSNRSGWPDGRADDHPASGWSVAAFAWLAEEGAANIGFAKRKILLDSVLTWIPGSAKDMLLADLFYPSIGLFQWLKVQAWHVRLRLKGNRFSAGRFVTGTCRPSGTVDTDHGVSHALCVRIGQGMPCNVRHS